MYKKCEVVMLPTKEDSNLYKTENVLRATWGFKPTGERFTYQHLYILSDDEVQEGDWVIQFNAENSPFSPVKYRDFGEGSFTFKKIIATNDSSLKSKVVDYDARKQPKYSPITGNFTGKTRYKHVRLPQPTENFVVDYAEQFNRGNIITDVLVEYEEINQRCASHQLPKEECPYNCTLFTPGDLILKVNAKDNTINIKKAKESWSREEVEGLLKKVGMLSFQHGIEVAEKGGVSRGDFTVAEWIEENLT